jgi:regulator of replication initiation timing
MNTSREPRTLISFDMGENRIDDTLHTIKLMNNNFGLLYDEIQRLKLENQKLQDQLNELTTERINQEINRQDNHYRNEFRWG